MEQQGVYDMVDWNLPNPPPVVDMRRMYVLPRPNRTGPPGITFWAISPAYTHCPSDSFPLVLPSVPTEQTTNNGARAQCNYGGSYGSQKINGTNTTICHPFTVFEQPLPGGNASFGAIDNKMRVSGIFSSGPSSISIADVTDGTSNTLLMGEMLPGCQWNSNNGGDAQAGTWINPWLNLISIGQGGSTITPINEFTPCVYMGPRRRISDPACQDPSNPAGPVMQYSYGFKSRHPGGVQVTLADGSVRFISQTINHATTWQSLGGRGDGNPIGDF
jgi:prepilin-type processing-associated H-X9-DG protein